MLVLKKTNHSLNQNWIANYNIWFATTPIIYKGAVAFPGLETAWLSGFTDADGSFGFKFAKEESAFKPVKNWKNQHKPVLNWLMLILSLSGGNPRREARYPLQKRKPAFFKKAEPPTPPAGLS
jgi:hypothetical protein